MGSNTYSEKVDFKLTLIKRDKEEHSILIKGEIHQKKITIIYQYAPNVNGLNFIKHTLKYTCLSPIDRSYKQKNNKQILDLKHTINQMDLADVYRIFHPASAQYTFFSAVHETFSKINRILEHKATLSKYKKIEIILCILSDHNALKLEFNNTNNSKNHANN
jgi:hypothetical protein